MRAKSLGSSQYQNGPLEGRMNSHREASTSESTADRPSAEKLAEEAMMPKATKGKRLALGFLSRVGSKEKYNKRLEKLTQSVRRSATTAAGKAPAHHEAGQNLGQDATQRKSFAAKLLAKRGSERILSFGSHKLGSSHQKAQKIGLRAEPESPVEQVSEREEAFWTEDPQPELPRYVLHSANPHSCSSKARVLPQTHSIDSDKLLFQNPFSEEPFMKDPALHGASAGQLPGHTEQQASMLEETNPFLTEVAQPPLESATNPFVAEVVEGHTARAGGWRDPELSADEAEEAPTLDMPPAHDQGSEGSFDHDVSQCGTPAKDEAVPAAALDPGRGHLIAGSFSAGAETVSISTLPPRTPKQSAGASSLRPGISWNVPHACVCLAII
jgi:hypothetical protein